MPIFIQQVAGSANNRIQQQRVRETPKNNFKNLPGISADFLQTEITKKQQTCKTVVKGSTAKLEKMKGSRFESASAQLNKDAVKAVPSYHNVLYSDQEDEQYYFKLRQAVQNQANLPDKKIPQ